MATRLTPQLSADADADADATRSPPHTPNAAAAGVAPAPSAASALSARVAAAAAAAQSRPATPAAAAAALASWRANPAPIFVASAAPVPAATRPPTATRAAAAAPALPTPVSARFQGAHQPAPSPAQRHGAASESLSPSAAAPPAFSFTVEHALHLPLLPAAVAAVAPLSARFGAGSVTPRTAAPRLALPNTYVTFSLHGAGDAALPFAAPAPSPAAERRLDFQSPASSSPAAAAESEPLSGVTPMCLQSVCPRWNYTRVFALGPIVAALGIGPGTGSGFASADDDDTGVTAALSRATFLAQLWHRPLAAGAGAGTGVPHSPYTRQYAATFAAEAVPLPADELIGSALVPLGSLLRVAASAAATATASSSSSSSSSLLHQQWYPLMGTPQRAAVQLSVALAPNASLRSLLRRHAAGVAQRSLSHAMLAHSPGFRTARIAAAAAAATPLSWPDGDSDELEQVQRRQAVQASLRKAAQLGSPSARQHQQHHSPDTQQQQQQQRRRTPSPSRRGGSLTARADASAASSSRRSRRRHSDRAHTHSRAGSLSPAAVSDSITSVSSRSRSRSRSQSQSRSRSRPQSRQRPQRIHTQERARSSSPTSAAESDSSVSVHSDSSRSPAGRSVESRPRSRSRSHSPQSDSRASSPVQTAPSARAVSPFGYGDQLPLSPVAVSSARSPSHHYADAPLLCPIELSDVDVSDDSDDRGEEAEAEDADSDGGRAQHGQHEQRATGVVVTVTGPDEHSSSRVERAQPAATAALSPPRHLRPSDSASPRSSQRSPRHSSQLTSPRSHRSPRGHSAIGLGFSPAANAAVISLATPAAPSFDAVASRACNFAELRRHMAELAEVHTMLKQKYLGEGEGAQSRQDEQKQQQQQQQQRQQQQQPLAPALAPASPVSAALAAPLTPAAASAPVAALVPAPATPAGATAASVSSSPMEDELAAHIRSLTVALQEATALAAAAQQQKQHAQRISAQSVAPLPTLPVSNGSASHHGAAAPALVSAAQPLHEAAPVASLPSSSPRSHVRTPSSSRRPSAVRGGLLKATAGLVPKRSRVLPPGVTSMRALKEAHRSRWPTLNQLLAAARAQKVAQAGATPHQEEQRGVQLVALARSEPSFAAQRSSQRPAPSTEPLPSSASAAALQQPRDLPAQVVVGAAAATDAEESPQPPPQQQQQASQLAAAEAHERERQRVQKLQLFTQWQATLQAQRNHQITPIAPLLPASILPTTTHAAGVDGGDGDGDGCSSVSLLPLMSPNSLPVLVAGRANVPARARGHALAHTSAHAAPPMLESPLSRSSDGFGAGASSGSDDEDAAVEFATETEVEGSEQAVSALSSPAFHGQGAPTPASLGMCTKDDVASSASAGPSVRGPSMRRMDEDADDALAPRSDDDDEQEDDEATDGDEGAESRFTSFPPSEAETEEIDEADDSPEAEAQAETDAHEQARADATVVVDQSHLAWPSQSSSSRFLSPPVPSSSSSSSFLSASSSMSSFHGGPSAPLTPVTEEKEDAVFSPQPPLISAGQETAQNQARNGATLARPDQHVPATLFAATHLHPHPHPQHSANAAADSHLTSPHTPRERRGSSSSVASASLASVLSPHALALASSPSTAPISAADLRELQEAVAALDAARKSKEVAQADEWTRAFESKWAERQAKVAKVAAAKKKLSRRHAQAHALANGQGYGHVLGLINGASKPSKLSRSASQPAQLMTLRDPREVIQEFDLLSPSRQHDVAHHSSASSGGRDTVDQMNAMGGGSNGGISAASPRLSSLSIAAAQASSADPAGTAATAAEASLNSSPGSEMDGQRTALSGSPISSSTDEHEHDRAHEYDDGQGQGQYGGHGEQSLALPAPMASSALSASQYSAAASIAAVPSAPLYHNNPRCWSGQHGLTPTEGGCTPMSLIQPSWNADDEEDAQATAGGAAVCGDDPAAEAAAAEAAAAAAYLAEHILHERSPPGTTPLMMVASEPPGVLLPIDPSLPLAADESLYISRSRSMSTQNLANASRSRAASIGRDHWSNDGVPLSHQPHAVANQLDPFEHVAEQCPADGADVDVAASSSVSDDAAVAAAVGAAAATDAAVEAASVDEHALILQAAHRALEASQQLNDSWGWEDAEHGGQDA